MKKLIEGRYVAETVDTLIIHIQDGNLGESDLEPSPAQNRNEQPRHEVVVQLLKPGAAHQPKLQTFPAVRQRRSLSMNPALRNSLCRRVRMGSPMIGWLWTQASSCAVMRRSMIALL